jgi:hypothetical protein
VAILSRNHDFWIMSRMANHILWRTNRTLTASSEVCLAGHCNRRHDERFARRAVGLEPRRRPRLYPASGPTANAAAHPRSFGIRIQLQAVIASLK